MNNLRIVLKVNAINTMKRRVRQIGRVDVERERHVDWLEHAADQARHNATVRELHKECVAHTKRLADAVEKLVKQGAP